MARYTVRLYSDFGMQPQDQTPILCESDDLVEVKNYIVSYFKYEDYFNAVYFIDNKLNKSGYVGRNLTIGYGESLFHFCEEPEPEPELGNYEVRITTTVILHHVEAHSKEEAENMAWAKINSYEGKQEIFVNNTLYVDVLNAERRE